MPPAWSREKSDRKLSAWAKKQDIARVEKELASTAKDLRRNGSLSLDPEYIMRRQSERERARDAAHRLSSIGLRLELDPLIVQPSAPSLPPPRPSRPPPSLPSSRPAPKVIKQQPESNEDKLTVRALRAEVERLLAQRTELENALSDSEQKREEERRAHEREKKLMVTTIKKLKAEVEEGWSRIIRLRESYGDFDPPLTNKLPARIYEEDEGFERVYRPSSRVSFKGGDQLKSKSLHPDDVLRRSDLIYRSQPSSPNRTTSQSYHQRVASIDNTLGHQSNLSIGKTPPRRNRRISFS